MVINYTVIDMIETIVTGFGYTFGIGLGIAATLITWAILGGLAAAVKEILL